MKKHVLIITGGPGVGKTTVLQKTVDALYVRGFSVGGMLSREVRDVGLRVGFEILDIASDSRGWLAHVNLKSGPRVGKYRVNLEDLNNIGVEAIVQAVEKCEVVAVDEIGPMELFSEKFEKAVLRALESPKLVLAVLHWKCQDRFMIAIRSREDADVAVVTVENRDKLPDLLVQKALAFLKPACVES